MEDLEELQRQLMEFAESDDEKKTDKPTSKKAPKTVKKTPKKSPKRISVPIKKPPRKVKIIIDTTKFLNLINEAHLAGRGVKTNEQHIKMLYRRGIQLTKAGTSPRDQYLIRYVLMFLEEVWGRVVHEVEDRD